MVRKFENPSDEINLNTLAIIFFLGLLILFGTYFAFFDKEKYVSHMVIQVCGYVQSVYNGVCGYVQSAYNRVCGYVQSVYNGVCGYVQSAYNRVCGYVQSAYNGVCGFVQNAYKTVLEHVQNNYRFLKGQLDKVLSYVSYSSVRTHFLSTIHTSNSDSFEFTSCADCTVKPYFEKEDYFKIEYNIPHNKNKISIFVHKILERIFDIPVDYGWISINFKPLNTNWDKYSSANFFVRGDGEPIKLEFSVYEADGDAWYFFDEKVLNTKDWVSVNMPFKDFVHPPWASLGDGKKEFKNVTMFQLTITSFDKAVNNTLYFKLKDNNLVYLE